MISSKVIKIDFSTKKKKKNFFFLADIFISENFKIYMYKSRKIAYIDLSTLTAKSQGWVKENPEI